MFPKSAHWQALQSHFEQVKDNRISNLFSENPNRFADFSIQTDHILLDYSKTLLSEKTRDLLLAAAESVGMADAIAAMFNGDIINNTEKRAVLHTALRSQMPVTPEEKEVHATLMKMGKFVTAVSYGDWKGYSGHPITDVVNIGIGGSDLGPAMAYEALKPFHQHNIKCHFVSNVDPVHIEQTLEHLDHETTLFVIASKTFTTMETLSNANTARRWFLSTDAEEHELKHHFVAVSSNIEKAAEFGVDPDNIFPMWDWVGGRYSMWSAIGLPVALGVGMDNFRAMLEGAHEMDEHFRSAPLAENLPVTMALLAIWHFNFFKAESQVILPYAQNLSLFPAFLQQLDMESLGSSVHKDGSPVEIETGGIVWGSAGTNGQHSFHQLLHQGTHFIPADFIAIKHSATDNLEQHEQLLANCFAQSQALMEGKSKEAAQAELMAKGMSEAEAANLASHKAIAGNKPSITLVMDKLSPASLGSLVALYEHKVYAQSVMLNLNAFDQWGVELGKVLSTDIYQAIVADGDCNAFDPSTNGLINLIKS